MHVTINRIGLHVQTTCTGARERVCQPQQAELHRPAISASNRRRIEIKLFPPAQACLGDQDTPDMTVSNLDEE